MRLLKLRQFVGCDIDIMELAVECRLCRVGGKKQRVSGLRWPNIITNPAIQPDRRRRFLRAGNGRDNDTHQRGDQASECDRRPQAFGFSSSRET